MTKTSDLRVEAFEPLPSPREQKTSMPASEATNMTVAESRDTISAILSGHDPRLLAVVGPCSIHDPAAALEYASRLNELRKQVSDTLYVVMRVYFEKPRTKLGWRGLILDPRLDGTYDVKKGLTEARSLLLKITEMGLPTGSEMLDPIVPQYIDDLVSWASIGARTTESQTHREMASGLSMPVGFKNGTDGSVETALNAMASTLHSHSFLGIDPDGNTAIIRTTGNDQVHVILRGGRTGPNYHPWDVVRVEEMLRHNGLPETIVIDCSHGNSEKDPDRQSNVLDSILDQRTRGRTAIRGFMVESNLVAGRQQLLSGHDGLHYGQSITDACIGWDQTVELLENAAARLRGAEE